MPYPIWESSCIFTLLLPQESPFCFLRAHTKLSQGMTFCMAVDLETFYSFFHRGRMRLSGGALAKYTA